MIDYEIRKSTRARHMRITIDRKGNVTVTLPHRMPNAIAHEFVTAKKEWVRRNIEKIKCRTVERGGIEIPPGNQADFKRSRDQALRLAQDRLEHFNTMYNLAWKSVTIRNTKSRWGSCSKKGNLNFSYRIAYLPPHLADYLVVHELCHLKEFNHSPDYWKLVEKAVPDFKRHRKLLKLL